MLPKAEEPIFNEWACLWCEEAFRWREDKHPLSSNEIQVSAHLIGKVGDIVRRCAEIVNHKDICNYLGSRGFPLEGFTPLELLEMMQDVR